ncbi:hypothetical protein EI290_07345 [Hymenobacter metallilatus]|uniref:PH domain-containing protein n=1 Tax=Hymenobacter metallilatus TaxID=2493666 RepID=A0A428JQ99_9BACT|nr:hypothetical protein EI290_07345 [Hymenobacter metallilatus]
MQNTPLGFHSSKLKKWAILLFIVPLMALTAIRGILHQQEPIITIICTLGMCLLSVVIFTPNVTLTDKSIAIEQIWSTRNYSFQNYKSVSNGNTFLSKIHFDDGRSYRFMNGIDILGILSNPLEKGHIETQLHERILIHIEDKKTQN